MKSIEIKAVHDSDMKRFLRSIGEYKRVINGDANCHFCDVEIDLDNIHGIFPHDNEIHYSCLDCHLKLVEYKYYKNN